MPEPFAPSHIAVVPPPAERTPLPLDGPADTRVLDAWCEWLVALATNAEAALAAAIAYRELDGGARDHWLSALEQDSVRVNVPRIAVYAPLLAVESDPERRLRITDAIGPVDEAATPRYAAQGLCGRLPDGACVAVLITPLYLDFVQVLACSYRADRGFGWVRHDPIVDRRHAPCHGERIEGTLLERTPLKSLIDDLAHAVLAHKRSGRDLPEALRVFADLFGPNVGGSSAPSAT
jgi:hypothetical protein